MSCKSEKPIDCANNQCPQQKLRQNTIKNYNFRERKSKIVTPLQDQRYFHAYLLEEKCKKQIKHKKQRNNKKNPKRIKNYQKDSSNITEKYIVQIPTNPSKTKRISKKKQIGSVSKLSKNVLPEQQKIKVQEAQIQSQANLYLNQHIINQQTINLSAEAYGVYDLQLNPLIQKNANISYPIASLVKLMTLYTAKNILSSFQITEQQFQSIFIKITVQAAKIGGSSSELTPKQWMTIKDLFYGTMLPSGNDASLALAHGLGGLLCEKDKYMNEIINKKVIDVVNNSKGKIQQYEEAFVEYMNKLSYQLELDHTQFANPHGLDHPLAFSSVYDISKITGKLFQQKFCREVLSTKKYNGQTYVFPKKDGTQTEIDWINTDKLLWKKGYIGGKTGQTPQAGNCLMTVYQPYQENKQQNYYIIVLGCKGLNDRFTDTQKLVNMLMQKISNN